MPETDNTIAIPDRKDGVLPFAGLIMTGDWLKLNPSDRAKFATEWGKLWEAMGKVNSKFNATVWAGHTDGSIVKDGANAVKPTRKEREGDKPGRKAKVKTLEEQLFGE